MMIEAKSELLVRLAECMYSNKWRNFNEISGYDELHILKNHQIQFSFLEMFWIPNKDVHGKFWAQSDKNLALKDLIFINCMYTTAMGRFILYRSNASNRTFFLL